jgi:hypothetical protein
VIQKIVLSAAVLLAAVFASTGALAQQGAGATDAWQFGVSIYGWFPDIAGETVFTKPDGSSDFKIDIDTILDNLEFTLMGIADVRKGRWGVLTDIIYMDVSGSKDGTREASIGGNQIPVGAAANVNLDIESWIWTIAGYYRVLEKNGGSLDVFAGTRYLDVEQSVDWNVTGNIGSIPSPGRQGAATVQLSNWDLIFGLRGRFAFGAQKTWFVPYYFDLGMGDSDFTWQGIAGLGYAFKWGEITAIWRYLYYDLPSDTPVRDVDFNGPGVGITFRW